MAWFRCPRKHVIESKSHAARDVFCGLCNKIVLKNECTKVSVYFYRPYSKSEAARKREENKRLQKAAIKEQELCQR